MLFLQGTRDTLADSHTLQAMVERLGKRATLKLFQDADHSFHVPARTGRTDAEVRTEMLDTLARARREIAVALLIQQNHQLGVL
jgi:hypothetical protein